MRFAVCTVVLVSIAAATNAEVATNATATAVVTRNLDVHSEIGYYFRPAAAQRWTLAPLPGPEPSACRVHSVMRVPVPQYF